MKNKLIYFSNSKLFSRKANSIQVVKMCNALKNKFDVTLCAYSNKYFNDINKFYGVDSNFLIENYYFEKFKYLRIFNPLIILLRKKSQRKNIIVFSRNRFGAFFSVILKFDFFYEIHNKPNNKINSLIESFILKSIYCKKIIFISEALKKMYVDSKLYNFDLKKSAVLHDGADFRKKPKTNSKKVEIGYVGHLYKGRGIDLIVELAKRFSSYNFNIVGGEENDIKRIKKIASKNIILHGFIPPGEVNNTRDKFDILLMPYKPGLSNEGSSIDTSRWMSPLKLFEYMSSGKAIISTDLPVIREVLNENNSILVPYDLESWVEKLDYLIKNEELRKKLGNYAHKDFIRNYTWEIRANKIFSFLNYES